MLQDLKACSSLQLTACLRFDSLTQIAFGTSQTRKTLSEMSEWEERVGIEKVVYKKNI